MLKISFDFDPASQQVSNMIVSPPVNNTGGHSSTPSIITLDGSTLRVTQDTLDVLGVAIGDKLCIRFNAKGDKPILATPKAVSEPNGGNLITKQLSVACRGASNKAIKALGGQFTYSKLREGVIELTPHVSNGLLGMSDDEARMAATELLTNSSEIDIPSQQDPKLQDEILTEPASTGEEFNFDFTIK